MPKTMGGKYNWPAIKQFFIVGKIHPETGENVDYSYNELAAMFHVKSESSIKKHADKEDWHKERKERTDKEAATLKHKLEEMKAQELPDIVEMRRKLLKIQLAILTEGLNQLNAHEMTIKPGDLLKSSEFIISEYHTLFGIPHPKVETEDKGVEIKLGKIDDLYDFADHIRKR